MYSLRQQFEEFINLGLQKVLNKKGSVRIT